MEPNEDRPLLAMTETRTQRVYRNFPMVPRVVYGCGSFAQLRDILIRKRLHPEAPFIFLVDDYFQGKLLEQKIPVAFNDLIIFISANTEPKTDQVDALVTKIRDRFRQPPSGIVGIGGGTLLDLAKAVAIMYNNPGTAQQYQGWDLVNRAAVYHVGIPTISGTGAEVSRTTVLMGPEKKLGINSDFTTFDQVVLDPDLTVTVPKDQWFYTGMDCFIHCVESLNGSYLNAFSQSYGEKAQELCEQVFLGDPNPSEAREMLMMASWHGGMSIAYSQVGVAHALSYGLGFLLGIHHGLGNCMVFDQLSEFYPGGVALFKQMRERHAVRLPTGVCSHLPESDFDTMINVALGLAPLWENALGPDWKRIATRDRLRAIYEKI